MRRLNVDSASLTPEVKSDIDQKLLEAKASLNALLSE